MGVCFAIGAVTVIATIAFSHGNRSGAGEGDEKYGRQLFLKTSELIGPAAVNSAMRFGRNNLECASCHLAAGGEPGQLSLTAAMSRYPRFSARSGANETIEDRINGCMIRSMNGRPLEKSSAEMRAMVAWLRFLANADAATGASLKSVREPPAFTTPARAADVNAGERVFGKRCAACHGKDGAGLAASKHIAQGYVFPPLWGTDSFNEGAGMHRLLTAARFVKAKMPPGEADLSDGEAFDVAAFVNSQARPRMAHLDRDYPDRLQKPVDAPYPPYADHFPVTQHQLGPFQAIDAYYAGTQKAVK
ncbi:MAG: c-type cytochrome [Acidobacteriota bacterium]|nr:c-type cytochrome [Acidobacteriota bacterium]